LELLFFEFFTAPYFFSENAKSFLVNKFFL